MQMPSIVAILEDHPGRVNEMRACLANALPGVGSVFFESASEMISWLGRNLGDVVLISLDHDLPVRSRGPSGDCGTGRQVVDYLATLLPTCPVIIHSSNSVCAPGMFLALRDAGWLCGRVFPCDDLAWIATAWGEEVKRYSREAGSASLPTGRRAAP